MNGKNVRTWMQHVKNKLLNAGLDESDAGFETKQLLAYALDEERIRPCHYQHILDEKQKNKLDEAVLRRLNHEPLQYIVGEWEFMGLPFKVNENVLIPRQDTETLCDVAEGFIMAFGYRSLLDICTGSGCIGISLAHRCTELKRSIAVTLSDINNACLDVARFNAEMNSVNCTLIESDLFSRIEGKFDIITANPPYIETAEIALLQAEVRREPELALDGGNDGLVFYRRIRSGFRDHLNEGGALVMEIGYNQGKSVADIFSDCGKVSIVKDICGQDRVVTILI